VTELNIRITYNKKPVEREVDNRNNILKYDDKSKEKTVYPSCHFM